MLKFGKGCKGFLIEKAQLQLEKEGFPPGVVDGIYGLKTEEAVYDFQIKQCGLKGEIGDVIIIDNSALVSEGLDELDSDNSYHSILGSLDNLTWLWLINEPFPGPFKKSLQLTSSFEGSSFSTVGKLDGISWGILQWNLKAGTLRPLLGKIPNEVWIDLENYYTVAEISLVRNNGNDIVYAGIKLDDVELAPVIAKILNKLGEYEEVQKVQLRDAFSTYWVNGTLADSVEFRMDSDVELAFLFDVNVQTGRLAPKISEKLIGRIVHADKKLITLAFMVANKVNPRWADDVFLRKSVYGNMAGDVHGYRYDLSNWGF